jgi:hypothetical protein
MKVLIDFHDVTENTHILAMKMSLEDQLRNLRLRRAGGFCNWLVIEISSIHLLKPCLQQYYFYLNTDWNQE